MIAYDLCCQCSQRLYSMIRVCIVMMHLTRLYRVAKEILGSKPNLLANGVVRHCRMMFVGIELHPLFHLFQIFSHAFQHTLHFRCKIFGSWCLIHRQGFNSHAGYIRLCCFKGCNLGQCMFLIIYRELGNGKPISPLILFFKAVDL